MWIAALWKRCTGVLDLVSLTSPHRMALVPNFLMMVVSLPQAIGVSQLWGNLSVSGCGPQIWCFPPVGKRVAYTPNRISEYQVFLKKVKQGGVRGYLLQGT